MRSNANARKTAKKPSKRAWWVAHAHRVVRHDAVVQQAAASAVAARAAVRAEAQVAIAVKVAVAADKSQRSCTKYTGPSKGNPLKRLK
jgi:predicted nicotinamide N-methyase